MKDSPNTSIDSAVERAQAAVQDIPVPEGLDLPTESHRHVWRQFSSMKLPKDWRKGDLVILHEAVRLECLIREAEATLALTGWVVETNKGELKKHPLAELLGGFRAQKIAALRAVGLNITAYTEKTTNKRALTQNDEEAVSKARAPGGKPQLLAVT